MRKPTTNPTILLNAVIPLHTVNKLEVFKFREGGGCDYENKGETEKLRAMERNRAQW